MHLMVQVNVSSDSGGGLCFSALTSTTDSSASYPHSSTLGFMSTSPVESGQEPIGPDVSGDGSLFTGTGVDSLFTAGVDALDVEALPLDAGNAKPLRELRYT